MKPISQFIAFLLVGADSLQILLTIGTAVLIFQLATRKVISIKSRWVVRKRKRALESNIWAID